MEELLSKAGTKRGTLQRDLLALLREHARDGALPTSSRFLFYELEGRGLIPKQYLKPDGSKKPRQPNQDISEALMHLREARIIPWDWITDETRTLYTWQYAESVYKYVSEAAETARVDLWEGEPPPLILCESRSLAGPLRAIAARYLCPLAATNGQVGGFLHTDVAPIVERAYLNACEQRVFYLGDFDRSGQHIEENTYKVLAEYGDLEWERVAITKAQVDARDLTVIQKPDHRYKPLRYYEAVETEALGQAEIVRLLTERLDRELPEPLKMMLEREESQRVQVRERLASEGE